MESALFVTRWQPFWKNHLDALEQAVYQWAGNLIICLWSANKESTFENPFDIRQRLEMTELAMKRFKIDLSNKWIYISYNIISMPDYNDIKKWGEEILNKWCDFDTVISWNEWVYKAFPNKTIFIPQERILVKWTHNRKLLWRLWLLLKNLESNNLLTRYEKFRRIIWSQYYKKLKENLPKTILKYILISELAKKMADISNSEWVEIKEFPKIAVDGLIFNDKWEIILIKRRFPPYGYALPWGFIDYWESTGEALIREMKEELSVNVEIIWEEERPFLVMSRPDRDPRSQVISIVYKAKIISWELKASDDAKEFIVVDPNHAINQLGLAFDHIDILKKAIN